MKRKFLVISAILLLIITLIVLKKESITPDEKVSKIERKIINPTQKGKKKTLEERAQYNEARYLYEFYRQVNPNTGVISKTDKKLEFEQAKTSLLRKNVSSSKAPETNYISRGPSNLGGRTRTVVVDISDITGNTMLAGGVSGGVFRTINGGTSWTKVSPNNEIHNVTAIAQDPRVGFQNIWYYATGEGLGNSANKSGSIYRGQGIWTSTDGGITWSQMPGTNSNLQDLDSQFDYIFNLAVNPTNGELYAATTGFIMRYNSKNWTISVNGGGFIGGNLATDVVITSDGRVYAAFSGAFGVDEEGIWTSADGINGWTRINTASFTPAGRVVLGLSPSNENKLYVLFVNGTSSDCDGTAAPEADLWMWNQSGGAWTNYSSKLPDETGCSDGNDPFAVQGGYDLVVSVKPNDEDFVVIGGTNAYKIEDIVNDASFTRIGGYLSASSYEPYTNHHPDIHALVFSPFNNNIMFSGTDGGVHVTSDITASTVAWTSLNNNYQTQQYYHVVIDPETGSDIVLGGLQDNGTNAGGEDWGQPDLTTQTNVGTGDGGAAAISRDDACLPFFISVQGGILYRDCPVFANITPEISEGVAYDSQFVTYFYLDPDNNNALYYAARNTLLRTTDATNVAKNTWTDMGSTITFGHFDDFQIFSTTRGTYNASTSYLLMGGDEGHIYRLDDPQNKADISTAVNITPGTATTGFPSIVSGLAIHPTNRDIVLATYSNYGVNSIYLTTNATSATPTWTLVERNLNLHSIRSAAIAEVAGQTIYFVGTARGLYSSTNPLTTDWVREAETEIGYSLVSSLAYRPSDNHLLIGTHGNGMYEAILTDNGLGIDDKNDISNQITLYPNPTSNEINIKLPNEFGNSIQYSIKNMLGQSISNGKLMNGKIDVNSLNSGLYFVEITTADMKGTKKFVKK